MRELLIIAAIITIVNWQSFGQLPKKSNTISVNGIDMYFEIYGEGEPLLLLHGWTQSSAFWKEYIPTYAEKFQIYAVDLRGHGRTSQLTSDFTIQKTAHDLLALMDHLNLEKVKAIGLSYGGLALLQLASLHPKRIESMILIGTSQKYNGKENDEINNTFSYENLPKSFTDELRKIHYHGESQIRNLFDKNLNYQINLTDEEIKRIDSRTLVVQGDNDEILGIDPAIRLHRNLTNSELWIVPDTGHIAIIGLNQKIFISRSLQFLNSKK